MAMYPSSLTQQLGCGAAFTGSADALVDLL